MAKIKNIYTSKIKNTKNINIKKSIIAIAEKV